MRQIYYTLRYLLRSGGNNGIKIVSLTLGLAMSLVLFTQIAFDMSYDHFIPDVDHIYRIRRIWNMGNDKQDNNTPVINAPVPGAMMKELAEVEKATVRTSWTYDADYFSDNEQEFTVKTMIADSLFFDLFGFPLLQGDLQGLKKPDAIYLSESAARRIYGNEDALGKVLKEGEQAYIVRGIFKDIPKNSHMAFDALQSMEIFGGRPGWHNNDAYVGYVKFVPGTDPKAVEAKIPDMLRKYYDVDKEIRQGLRITYFFEPVKNVHMSEPAVKKTIMILWFMAFSILLIAALNYVMISISSLVKKSKMIGVHKCNGASPGDIFVMFIYETLALIFVSLILAVILILAFKEKIEELMHTSLANLFSLDNLWVVGVVIVILVIIAGVIPGRIFSSIPVTQVFRNFGANKRLWKRVLLFIQFGGVAFIFTLLLILVRQYSLVMNEDLGYDTENIVYSQNLKGIYTDQMPLLKEEFDRYPLVVKSSIGTTMPIDVVSGTWIKNINTQESLFSSRFTCVDKNYLDVMGITLLKGENFKENINTYNQMIVNEKFLELAGVKDDPIGKVFNVGIAPKSEIIGVVKNYHLQSLYTEQLPLVIFPMEPSQGTEYYGKGNLILKLSSSDRRAVQEFDEKLRNFTHNPESYFRFYSDAIGESYKDARLLRNSISIAALVLFIITIMGILGYVTDEILNRTKEIGIRRINGASASSILKLIATDILIMAIPAIIIGMTVSWIIGHKWQEQFVVKASWDAGLFLTSGLFVLLVITLSVIVRSWHAANDNPVNSLRSE